ncbi:MAG: hypothetical protein HC922_07865 [Leptolyngbyaceae cyanobacterium SM2_3_12]|nr:hypothetical protein [Leptolyngbyaceae cyanobacterium SM2_3_12]
MANTVQDKVKADWEKAQKEGGQRVERIREIVKAAATEALAELKGGFYGAGIDQPPNPGRHDCPA